MSTLNEDKLYSHNEWHAKFLKWLRAIELASWRAKEGEVVGTVHQQEMIMASQCISRKGEHKTACQRNLAIPASALPANLLPATAAVLD